MNTKRILIGCERSGAVRRAFNEYKGIAAYSCDLAPCDDGQAAYHKQCDIFHAINRLGPWELLVVHPPCTYLSVSGMHWTTRGFRDPALTVAAIAFTEKLWACGIAKICLENPTGVLSTRSCLGKPAQYIQPYQFGDDASKRTGLWLRGLPALKPTKHVNPRMVDGKPRWGNQTDSGQNRMGPSADRAVKRSATYSGIAAAMAAQWSSLL